MVSFSVGDGVGPRPGAPQLKMMRFKCLARKDVLVDWLGRPPPRAW